MSHDDLWEADMPPEAVNSTMQRMRAEYAARQRHEWLAQCIVLGLLALVVIAQFIAG
jgi:hypothetical protein